MNLTERIEAARRRKNPYPDPTPYQVCLVIFTVLVMAGVVVATLSCGGGTITTPDPPPVQVEPATVTWITPNAGTYTIEAWYSRGTPDADVTIWTGTLTWPGELTHTFPDATTERIRFRYWMGEQVLAEANHSVYDGGEYTFSVYRVY